MGINGDLTGGMKAPIEVEKGASPMTPSNGVYVGCALR
jgi:hypothetical protein